MASYSLMPTTPLLFVASDGRAFARWSVRESVEGTVIYQFHYALRQGIDTPFQELRHCSDWRRGDLHCMLPSGEEATLRWGEETVEFEEIIFKLSDDTFNPEYVVLSPPDWQQMFFWQFENGEYVLIHADKSHDYVWRMLVGNDKNMREVHVHHVQMYQRAPTVIRTEEGTLIDAQIPTWNGMPGRHLNNDDFIITEAPDATIEIRKSRLVDSNQQ